MSDAPETIWAYTQSGTNVRIWRSDNARPVSTEYTRADLPPTREQIMADPRVIALVEALGRIKKRDGCGSSYITCHDCYDSSHEANAALAALTDNEGETE